MEGETSPRAVPRHRRAGGKSPGQTGKMGDATSLCSQQKTLRCHWSHAELNIGAKCGTLDEAPLYPQPARRKGIATRLQRIAGFFSSASRPVAPRVRRPRLQTRAIDRYRPIKRHETAPTNRVFRPCEDIHSGWNITSASTYPCNGWWKAKGKRPTTSKPSFRQRRNAPSFVLTTKLNCIPQ
jgi:hypothetical protein